MDLNIKTKLSNTLKAEAEYVLKNEKSIDNKLEKLNTLFNFQKIIDNYDELEPVLKKFFAEKAREEKWDIYK